MSVSEDFDPENLDTDSENMVATFALTAIFASLYPSSGGEAALSLMKRVASVVMSDSGRGASKAENLHNFLTSLEALSPLSYQGLISALSGFSSLETSLKEKIDASLVTGDLDECSLTLTSLVFGYSTANDQAQDFWPYLKKNQEALFSSKTPLSEDNLSLIFSEAYNDLKLAMLNSGPKEDIILYILKYTNVERLFDNSQPILPNLMKDSEIQSYRISGGIKYFYGFDPSILDCEPVYVDGVHGYKTYPCNRVSVKPRDLQFNQIITDGPYSSGKSSMADDGITLLTSIKNSHYDSSRIEEPKLLGLNAYFVFYNSGWILTGFPDFGKPVNLGGDVAFANNASSFKNFPEGAETGQFHFLSNYTFVTGTGAGQTFDYKGFEPILLRLNSKDESSIYSKLEVNLLDKVKRSGQLMSYSISTNTDADPVLRSFNPEIDSPRYPLLSINKYLPDLPFVGINLDFSSKTFNKAPSARFNFGKLYYVPPTKNAAGGAFTRATDFSFTAFDITGDYFDLSKGSIKFNKEIKNTDNFNPEEYFVNQTDKNGKLPPQSGSMLLQKALGFSNYEDCITGAENVKNGSHYGVEYKFIEDLTPTGIESEKNEFVRRVGDTGILKYITGLGPAGNISPLLSKTVFGPLDSNTDQGLDGKDFNYKYLPADYEGGELAYGHAPALNPARYYSGLFASERRQFLYPNAKKIHAKNKYFPSQVRLLFKVEEEYSKSANGGLSRYKANVQKTTGELNGYWVDQDFSHPNIFRGLLHPAPYWTYNPLTNRNLNHHFQYLNGDVSISDGKLNGKNLTAYGFDRIESADTVELHLPNTPLSSNLKEVYSFDIELNYTLPIKSLSDFKEYPENSNKSFVSTGDSEIALYGFGEITGWTKEINEQVNNGADPLFNPSYTKGLDDSENISGDSWNGFYLRSGSVFFPNSHPPYRDPSADKILIEGSDNSSNLRLFLKNLKLFPTFVNNDQDLSYGSGESFVNESTSEERQRTNLLDSLRVFEINEASIFDKIPNDDTAFSEVSSFSKSVPLNISIEKNILRSGKLYYAPELVDGSVILPEVSAKEYKKITDLYPQLGDYRFYSGVDAYSRLNSGYRIEYKESSNLKLTITGAEVKYDRFPASDELFEFHLTGSANFSGELSYLTQEESCVITHGMHLKEQPNEADEFQKIGYFFNYCSPQIRLIVNDAATEAFPTKQVRRKKKFISEENIFIPTSRSAPDYLNRFYIKTIPEFVLFSNMPSILGDFGVDHLLNPACSLISSSSSNDAKEYDNGEMRVFTEVSKKLKVEDNIRFYDAFFTNALDNSGFFLQKMSGDLILDVNKENKTFYAPFGSFICDLEAGQEKNQSITLVKDRGSDHNEIRDDNKPTGAIQFIPDESFL